MILFFGPKKFGDSEKTKKKHWLAASHFLGIGEGLRWNSLSHQKCAESAVLHQLNLKSTLFLVSSENIEESWEFSNLAKWDIWGTLELWDILLVLTSSKSVSLQIYPQLGIYIPYNSHVCKANWWLLWYFRDQCPILDKVGQMSRSCWTDVMEIWWPTYNRP